MSDFHIHITLDAVPELGILESEWRSLETRARPGFFTSWTWIGTWLHWLPGDVKSKVLRASRGGQTVGLAVIVDGGVRSSMGVPLCATQYLHATGRPVLDALLIEHNGFVVDRGCEHEVSGAMLRTWLAQMKGSAEAVLPGLPSGRLDASLLREVAPRAHWKCERTRTSYAMDLARIRASGGDPLAGLSPNCRSQIRRSMKAYQTLGPLALHEAATVDMALAWMDEMTVLHQARWTAKGFPGAFSSAEFIEFHRAMVRCGVPRGEVKMTRVTVGDRTLAVLYSFVCHGRVHFYQGGLEYGLIDKHARPGLVAHAMAAGHLAAQGFDVYDFMAGEARYKSSLSDLRETMVWAVVQTPSVRLALERSAHRWHRRQHGAAVSPEGLAG